MSPARRVSRQSMTGYGRATKRTATGSVTVELRSTNHRFLEVDQRWPNGFTALQGRVVELLRGYMRRGRIEAQVFIQADVRDRRRVTVDEALASRYFETLSELKTRFGLKGPVTLDHLLELPHVISVVQAPAPTDQLWGSIRDAVEAAVRELVSTREREGAKLAADIRRQLQDILRHVRAAKARLPKALAQQRRETRARLRELLGNSARGSTTQLEGVVALLKESDVHEEVVRLDSHVAHMRQTLAVPGSVGKRLDFIAQELTREANTLGAKVNDALAARHVVDIKSAIERIREQVQNLE